MNSCILHSFLGALAQEVMHWLELRGKLGDPGVKALMISKAYWVITISTIITSTVGVWEFYEAKNFTHDMYFVLGAAFPLIFKKLVSTVAEGATITLGNSTVKTYFGIS